MTESSSFSSLLELVDSHLSKVNIQEKHLPDAPRIPSLLPTPNCTQSETGILICPNTKLPIPSLGLSQSPIQNVLAGQVANMLKAKELKRQQDEEKQKIEEEMKKKQSENVDNLFVIDLMSALQTPCPPLIKKSEPTLSSSSSFELLFEPNFIDCDLTPEKSPEPLLPCSMDMSWIINEKIQKGKCSAFGKVLCAKFKRVAAPYLKVKTVSTIKRFDFKTKSPCDIIKEKLRRPTTYNTHNSDSLVLSSSSVSVPQC